MLKLGLDLSLGNVGGWTPQAESSLEAWFKNKTKVSFQVAPNSDRVYAWLTPTNNKVFLSENVAESPTYNATTGAMTFDPSATQHMSEYSLLLY